MNTPLHKLKMVLKLAQFLTILKIRLGFEGVVEKSICMALVEKTQEFHHHIQVFSKAEEDVKIYSLCRDGTLYPGMDEDVTEDPKELILIVQQDIGEK